MKGIVLLLLIAILFSACGSKDDNDLTGAQAPAVNNEFTNQFEVIKLKYTITDTSLDRNVAKEKPLKFEANKYFPESLIYDYFEKGQKINFYPIGKVQNGDGEIYLLMKAISGPQKAAYVLVYDNKLNYRDGSMICQTDGDSKTVYLASLDRFFNINIRRTDFLKNGESAINEIYLAYNNAGKLGQVVTNATAGEADFINPIDTLPATKKHTGDYYLDNDNMISLRDAPDSGRLMMFFKYDKSKETCEGEIKDFVRFIDANTFVYQKDGDPCNIEFKISGNTITVKEGTDCGNKKGAFDCTLNGSFSKREKKAKSNVNLNEVINPLGAKPPKVDPTITNPNGTPVPANKTTKVEVKKPKGIPPAEGVLINPSTTTGTGEVSTTPSEGTGEVKPKETAPKPKVETPKKPDPKATKPLKQKEI
jgi:hypothetical protein